MGRRAKLTQEQPHRSNMRDAGRHNHREGVERSVADQQTDKQHILLQPGCRLVSMLRTPVHLLLLSCTRQCR